VMSVARETGALVMVHAENYDAIRFLTDRLERGGHTAPHFHGVSRPIPVEREATHRAISLAELVDVPIMIVHVSNGEAMEEIRRAQQRGLKIFGETCPQYLVLTAKHMEGLNMEGAKYVCSPPPRDAKSQQECWAGLQQGVFSVFSSDHCPFRYDDAQGKLNPKGRTSFRWVPNGIPGVETRLPILFSEGVNKGRISLNDFVALTATNHAKTYGLYPKKGTIAVGSDADIAIWDPERQETISQALLHHGSDYTPYEGIAVTGWPVSTIVRGTFVVRDGKLVGAKGGGSYVGRAKSPYAAPRGAMPRGMTRSV
jgi:dihydropyrimidinase